MQNPRSRSRPPARRGVRLTEAARREAAEVRRNIALERRLAKDIRVLGAAIIRRDEALAAFLRDMTERLEAAARDRAHAMSAHDTHFEAKAASV